MTRPHLRHRLEHALLLGIRGVVIRLPERIAISIGTALGWIAGVLLRIRRRVVLGNLERAFPGRSRKWRSGVADATYRHFGREAVSILWFTRLSPHEIRERFEMEGLELLQEPVEKGRGVVVLLGHFGNWELAALGVTSRGIPVDAVARRQRNPLFDAVMTEMRLGRGVGVLDRDQAARQVLRRLREPRAVALVADQNAPRDGVFVDFFGSPASTTRGPATLAIRAGAPVLFASPRRMPGAKAKYRIRFRRLPYEPSGDLDEEVLKLTRSYMEVLEHSIRDDPDQYFWFHRRWKTRPPTREPGSSPEVAPPPGEPQPHADVLTGGPE